VFVIITVVNVAVASSINHAHSCHSTFTAHLHTVGRNDGLVWVWISWASSQHFVDNCYFVQLFCSFLTSCFDVYLIFNISSPEARNFAPLLTWIFDPLWIDGIFLVFFSFRKDRFWKIFGFFFWFDKNFLHFWCYLIFLIRSDVTYGNLKFFYGNSSIWRIFLSLFNFKECFSNLTEIVF